MYTYFFVGPEKNKNVKHFWETCISLHVAKDEHEDEDNIFTFAGSVINFKGFSKFCVLRRYLKGKLSFLGHRNDSFQMRVDGSGNAKGVYLYLVCFS